MGGPLSLFRRKPNAGRAKPQLHPTRVGVNVTVTHREAKPDGIDWTPPDAQTVAHIDAHLPNRPASPNLRACRHAAVLDQEAKFLADPSGKTEPPDRHDVIEACRFAAESIRDGIVIA